MSEQAAEAESVRTAQSYRVHRGGLEIDGKPFPWHVIAEPGPLTQRMGVHDDMHILWLPVVVDAALPPETSFTPTEEER